MNQSKLCALVVSAINNNFSVEISLRQVMKPPFAMSNETLGSTNPTVHKEEQHEFCEKSYETHLKVRYFFGKLWSLKQKDWNNE